MTETLLLLALLASPPLPPPLEVEAAEGRARIGVGVEYDSNAKRIPVQEGELIERLGDGLLRLSLDANGSLETGDTWWSWSGAVGSKLFLEQRTEQTLVGQGRIAAVFPLGLGWRAQVSGFGKARAQVSGARTYAITRTDAAASKALTSGLVFRGGLYGSTFQSGDAPLFSSSGGGARLGLSWFITPREVLDLSVDGQLRAYPFLGPAPQPGQTPLPGSRIDVPASVQLALRSTREPYVDINYAITRNGSNSRGETFTRHRVSALLGTRLPAKITATLKGSLQLTQYDDGLSVGQRIFLNVEDESQNALALALSRPWIGGIVVEARMALYTNELADEGLSFSRTTASLGIRSEL